MTPEQHALLDKAREAATGAYAPYSRFRVGAAVLAGGRVFTGANVENASSNLGICAERVALAAAVTAGARDIEGLAVCCLDAPAGDLNLTLPCGGCRQWLAELAPHAWVVSNGLGPEDGAYTVDDLLPRPFRLRS